MLLLEAFFKFANAGVLLALIALTLSSKQNNLNTNLVVLICASFLCSIFTTGNELLRINGPIALPLRLFDTIGLVCLWILSLSLFNDNFRLRPTHWIISVAHISLMIIGRVHYLGHGFAGFEIFYFGNLVGLFSVSLMAHMGWVAIKGRNEDLVESRRKARVYLIVAAVIVIFSGIMVERVAYFTGWEQGHDYSLYINYVFMLPIGLAFLLWLTRFESDALKFHKAAINTTDLDAKDQISYDKLIETMHVQRAFAEHGLTIGKLAERVNLPAHQLRPLINNTLGYSNFSSFLNHYRIEEIKQRLSDAELARTPILTLALDAGFSTLSTFNRAFKLEVGVTPTEFRNSALKQQSLTLVQPTLAGPSEPKQAK